MTIRAADKQIDEGPNWLLNSAQLRPKKPLEARENIDKSWLHDTETVAI